MQSEGLGLQNVIKATIYLSDLSRDIEAVNAVSDMKISKAPEGRTEITGMENGHA